MVRVALEISAHCKWREGQLCEQRKEIRKGRRGSVIQKTYLRQLASVRERKKRQKSKLKTQMHRSYTAFVYLRSGWSLRRSCQSCGYHLYAPKTTNAMIFALLVHLSFPFACVVLPAACVRYFTDALHESAVSSAATIQAAYSCVSSTQSSICVFMEELLHWFFFSQLRCTKGVCACNTLCKAAPPRIIQGEPTSNKKQTKTKRMQQWQDVLRTPSAARTPLYLFFSFLIFSFHLFTLSKEEVTLTHVE